MKVGVNKLSGVWASLLHSGSSGPRTVHHTGYRRRLACPVHRRPGHWWHPTLGRPLWRQVTLIDLGFSERAKQVKSAREGDLTYEYGLKLEASAWIVSGSTLIHVCRFGPVVTGSGKRALTLTSSSLPASGR